MKPSTISPAEPILGSQSIDAVYSGEDADWETSGESGGILVEDGDYVSVPGVDRLIFDGGELTDNGDGSVTIDLLTEQDVIALITPDTTTCDSISIISSKGSIGQGTHADLHAVGGTLVRIDETATTPGINLEIAFSGLDGITDVYVHGYYTANHTVTVDIYNYDTTTWTTILTFSTSGSATELLHAQLADGDPYVDGSGNAKLRAYHAAAGNPTHDLFLDFVSLAHVAGGGGGLALDGLSDVDAPTPDDGDVLTWDDYAGAWVNAGPPSGTVPDGTDPGDLLVWDGASWDVWPIGADNYPPPNGQYDEEFATYSGWSAYGSPAFEVANVTDFPGKLHLRWAGVAATYGTSGIYKAMPLSPPYVLELSVPDALMSENHHWWGLAIFESGSPPTKHWQCGALYSTNGQYVQTGGWTNSTTRATNTETAFTFEVVGARLIVTSHKQITYCYTRNGRIWQHYLVPQDPGFTIANWGIVISRFVSGTNTYMELIADYLRARQPGTPAIPAMTSNSAPSGTASAKTEYGSGYAAYAAMGGNGTNSSGWLSASSDMPTWVQYQFGSGTTAIGYSLFPWVADNFPGRTPKTWVLKGSNNGTDWTNLDTQTDLFPKLNDLWYFPISSPASYAYYRLDITANNGNSYCGLNSFQLYT